MKWWSVEDIDVAWLSEVLHTEVDDFTGEPFGTSLNAIAVRVFLRSGDISCPHSVIVKAANPDHHGTDEPFRREFLFYSRPPELAIDTVAQCLDARFTPDTGEFWLVLDDAGSVRRGDELLGTTRGKAQLAVAALADLHATFRDNASVADWIPAATPIDHRRIGELYVRFVENYGERIDFRDLAMSNQIVASISARIAHQQQTASPLGLVHGDFRLSNILFGRSGSARPVTISQWQRFHLGHTATDLATFLGTALSRPMRLDSGDMLIAAYHEALGAAATGSLESLRRDVRDSAFMCVVNAIESWSSTPRTARTDDFWLTMFSRACVFLIDLEGPPDLGRARPAHTYAEPADEMPHPAVGDGEWNETWYLDVADNAAGIGAFIRFGVGPENPNGWFGLGICGPGIPTVTIFESGFDQPNPLRVHTPTLTATHDVVTPLAQVHVQVAGIGSAHDDPEQTDSGAIGQPVQVHVDLRWYTSGSPYQFDLTRVYEIPCIVTGSISLVGDGFPTQPLAINGPGQRSHSWDGQNWWHIEWFWLSAHFEDGTHLHGVDIRLSSLPSISMGYAQPPGAPVMNLAKCRQVDSVIDAKRVHAMTFALEPGSSTLTFRAIGHAPLRMQSDSGPVTVIPRAWGEFTRSDGHRGLGWVEWNTGSPNV